MTRGTLAWVSGQPFIFPSLGPTAFILTFDRRGERTRAYRVVGSQTVGGVVGGFAYTVFASGVTLTALPEALSPGEFQLAASGLFSIVLTSWGMIATKTSHALGCATTLIISLGVLSTPAHIGTMLASVVILVGAIGDRSTSSSGSPRI